MSRRSIRLSLAVLPMAILLAAPLASAQAAPIVNGGFETGTLEGWTATSETGAGAWSAITGTKPPLSGMFGNTVPAPFEGSYDAVADEVDPDSMVLSQEVALTPGVSHELSLELNYRSAIPFVTPSPDTLSIKGNPNQQVLVDVMKAGSPVSSVEPSDILATLLQTQEGAAEVIGWTRLTADLTPFAGQTVRIRVVDANNQNDLNVGVDAVSITNQTVIPPPLAPAAAPAPAPAALSIAKPRPLKMKVGKPKTVKVKVTNTGATATTQGSLRVKGVKGVIVKPGTQKLPVISPGASWTVSVSVELTGKAKKKSTLSLVGTASGVTAKGSLVVKLTE
jgi:hypothetical protein